MGSEEDGAQKRLDADSTLRPPKYDRPTTADDPLPLDVEAQLAGEWWTPDDPGATAYGILTYKPEDGLQLRLTSGRDIVRFDTPIPWLHGLTVDGRPVTLRNSFVSAWSHHIPGGIDARVHVHEAFVGMHAASERETFDVVLAGANGELG